MPIVARSETIISRNRFGQFASELERASRRVTERMVNTGAKHSRRLAPRGKHRSRYDSRPGYIPLVDSIRTRISFNGTRGYWYSTAPHALFVEEGTKPHFIEGNLRFWWKGGFFYWNNPQYGPVGSGKPFENWTESRGAWVWHPGTQAQPFLRPAFEIIRFQAGEIAREEFAKTRL